MWNKNYGELYKRGTYEYLCNGPVRIMTHPVQPVVVECVQVYSGGSVPVVTNEKELQVVQLLHAEVLPYVHEISLMIVKHMQGMLQGTYSC
jgi:hypothetical protein